MFPLFPDWQVKGILLCLLRELRGCKSSQGAMYRHGDWWPKDPCGFLYYTACSYTHPWNLHGETYLVCNWFKVLGVCRRQPYQLLNVSTLTFVHYILHHNGAECCRFLNTDRPFRTFSHVWCKNNSIPKFFHVLNIHFCPSNVCSLIRLVWAHCALGGKVSFEHLLMCMQIPSLFYHLHTCTLQA